MRVPYQCLATVNIELPRAGQVLLAACGAQLFVYDLSNSEALAVWPVEDSKDIDDGSNSSTEIITVSNEPIHRAKKRRKISKKRESNEAQAAYITNLVVSSDSRYAVASTGEDKLVHVFEIQRDGALEHLSQRRMTKRPCALAFTDDHECILVGDKTGDVYSLPLRFSEAEDSTLQTPLHPHDAPQNQFKPSATNLTVHTQRNLNALRNQMEQAQLQPPKPRETMDFPHELLLGHVSMLTDIHCIKVPSPITNSPGREYIITSDRDEHIRVSRGKPQAHIIENYCFGHRLFISKLCLARPDILISGGGDDCLFVWDWRIGKLLGVVPLLAGLQSLQSCEEREPYIAPPSTSRISNGLEASNGHNEASGEYEIQTLPDRLTEQINDEKIAISGIWAPPSTTGSLITIYCACEAIPAIFEIRLTISETRGLTEDNHISQTYRLPGNPVDMTFVGDEIVISVDNVHERLSTVARRKEGTVESINSRLMFLKPGTEENFEPLSVGMDNGEELVDEGQFQKVENLLYWVETLRKYGGEDAE